MRASEGRRRVRRGLVLALLGLGAVGLSPVQAALAASTLPTIGVHSGSGSGFSVTGDLNRHAGRVLMNFTNSNAHGSDVVLLKLLHGTSMATVIRDIAAQGGEKTAAASTRALTRETHLFGGAGLQAPGQSAQVTETLYSGTYYLLDVNAIFAGHKPMVKALHVHGTPTRSTFPHIGAIIAMNSPDRFVSPSRLPVGQNLLVRNVSDTIHFVAFQPVRAGTTDADMTKLFKGESKNDPYTGPGVEADDLSPGTQLIFHSSVLKKGRYDLECFIADDVTGMPHALMGMHKIVTVA